MSKKIKRPVVDESKYMINSPSLPSNVGLCISFKDFNKESICIDNFNNYFINESECFSLMQKALIKLKHISNYNNFNKLQSDGTMHCHAIENKSKKLVKAVLKEYGFSTEKIEELFEGKIYQVKIADGKPASRLVFYLLSGYILVPLFLDTNHQLYKDKSHNHDNNLKSRKYSL